MNAESQMTLQCMEIWGGNHHANERVSLAGLDAWIYSRPHGDATDGGDVHYVSSCATGRITRLLIADVSGHGKLVANIATELRVLMRRYVNYISQNRFLAEMNQQFLQSSNSGRFATAIAMTYFSPTNELIVCNAGHPRPLVYRAATQQWEVLQQQSNESDRPVNIPLGVTNDASYEPVQIQLALGDRLLCYTDSIIEARHARDDSLFGEKALCELLNTIDINEENFIGVLLSRIEAITAAALEHDDLTVMLMQPNTTAYKVPVSAKLKAPVLLIKGMLKSLLSKDYPLPKTEMTLRNIGGALFDGLNKGGKE
jgi:serine phosphatase RsbU (regulator of sigma subunit)